MKNLKEMVESTTTTITTAGSDGVDETANSKLIYLEKYLELETSPAKLTIYMKSFAELSSSAGTRRDVVVELTRVLKNSHGSAGAAGIDLEDEVKSRVLNLIGTIAHKGNFTLPPDVDLDDEKMLEMHEVEYKEFKKVFTILWSEVMKWDKSPKIHKQVLILLPEKVMSHLTKPLYMSQFFLESFKLGGPLSLLSLHGIFLLMQNFNFDVPDFYQKLYSLFQPPIFYASYKERFFAYSNVFLSSTHLPEYLVGSFVKKLSRMSLHAPTPCLPLIFDFIINLLLQHQGLKVLIKNPKVKSLKEDPFIDDEVDPIKTRSMESSLWEIKTLQNHLIPEIANAANFIDKPLPKVEKELEASLSLDYQDMFSKELKRFQKFIKNPNPNKDSIAINPSLSINKCNVNVFEL